MLAHVNIMPVSVTGDVMIHNHMARARDAYRVRASTRLFADDKTQEFIDNSHSKRHQQILSTQNPASQTMSKSTSFTGTPIVDSKAVFKPDIFAGKVLFCTGGGSGICKSMTESIVCPNVSFSLTFKALLAHGV